MENGLAPCVCVCTVALQKARGSFDSSKQSFPFTTGPSVIDKSFVVNFFQIIINKAMHNTIADTCHGDFTAFVVADDEFSIDSVPIVSKVQILKKGVQIFLEIILKFVQFNCPFFALSEPIPASPNIF